MIGFSFEAGLFLRWTIDGMNGPHSVKAGQQ